MNKKVLFFIALIAYGSYYSWQKRSVTYGPGVTVATEPMQSEVDDATSVEMNGYQVKPLEEFSIEARVLGAEHYSMGRESDLAPVDLALGWGPMSDESVLKDISISQSNRFYYWHVDTFPISRKEIETHSANMHMIPADDDIEERLKDIRPGQIVSISGYLVEVKASDGWHWRSSLSRSDTGNGACELVLVKSLHVS